MFVPISSTVVAGRYELIDEIGRGGMGVVWRARQANLGVECAIKFIHEAHAHDPDVRRRFVREARVAASLKTPNSVQILDVDEWQGTLFIAMELLSGESLEARLSRDGSLSPRFTLDVLEQVARGLNKAHAAQLIHRDLKPDNIFIVDDDPLLVKILDFGIAKRMSPASGLQTTSGVLIGTPGYMSPEQADGGKEIDFRSDLWSLAVVAFRCLTGFVPFDGDGVGQVLLKLMTAPIPAPRNLRPELPASVDEWWFRVIQREPSQRPPSATALVNGLREALADAARDAPEALGLETRGPSIESQPARSQQNGPQQPPSQHAKPRQPSSQQATLHPVSSRPGRRSRPLGRYAVGGVAVVAVFAWVLSERWAPSMPSESDGARPASAQPGLEADSAPRPASASRAASSPLIPPEAPGVARAPTKSEPVVRTVADGSGAPETTTASLEPASRAPAPAESPAAARAPAAAAAASATSASSASGSPPRPSADAPRTTASARTKRRPASAARAPRVTASPAPRAPAPRASRAKTRPVAPASPARAAAQPAKTLDAERPSSSATPTPDASDPRLGF